MAQLSKRKRDAARFGKAERLADYISSYGCRFPLHVIEEGRTEILNCCARASVVDIDNVVTFYNQHIEKVWKWDGLPPCRFPFSTAFFEAGLPVLNVRPVRGPFAIQAFGVFLVEEDPKTQLELPDENLVRFLDSNRLNGDLPMLREQCTSLLSFLLFVLIHSPKHHADPVPFCIGKGSYFLGNQGRILRPPVFRIDPDFMAGEENRRGATEFIYRILFTTALALGFINMKGVEVKAIEPNPNINRERRKAGLKPFVHYHTIDIEPTREVLRTEGQIEEVGLTRALHLCRGHWATYGESFMGRKLDRPLTVWRPWHMRGSAREGLVVSDYRVHAPATSGEGNH